MSILIDWLAAIFFFAVVAAVAAWVLMVIYEVVIEPIKEYWERKALDDGFERGRKYERDQAKQKKSK